MATLSSFVSSLRAVLFYAGYHSALILFTIGRFLVVPLMNFEQRYWFLVGWNRFVIVWLKLCCGVRFEVTGLENVPDRPCVILSNHQSPWETIYLQTLFNPLTTILKKELLKIPFFGWCLAALEPIAIDRSNPREALRQMRKMGKTRLRQERSLLIFPEGTRHKYGEHGKYARGGASIAKDAGVEVLFIAHDAGKCWPAHQMIKVPGTIHVTISEPHRTEDLTPAELTTQAREWIDEKLNLDKTS